MRRPLARRTPEEARQDRIRRAVERGEREDLLTLRRDVLKLVGLQERRSTSLGGAITGQPSEATRPETDPSRLEMEFAPHPTISQWISRLYQGELEWAQIDTIRKNAEYGYTEQWADFTRRMYKTDDHILSTMMTYVGAVAGARREVLVRKGVPAQYAEIAQQQAAACEVMLDSLPNCERSIADLVDGDFVGYAISELIWEERGDWLYPVDLQWMHPDRFRFSQHFEPYLWDRGLAAMRARELGLENAGVDGLGMPLAPNKFVVHVPRLIPEYPMGSGILFAVTRPWFVKNWCTKFALGGAEIAGVPRYLGTVMNSAPQSVRDALYDALSNLSADAVGVVSEGTNIQILDPKMQGNGSVWDFLLKRQDAAISKAILGSTLNVEVGDQGGNRALGESQASMTIYPRWARSARLVGNTLEAQLFRPFLEMNRHLWGGHVFVPNIEMHIVEDEPAVDELAVNSGVVTKDELRRSRKLVPLGPERGGDDLIPATATSADASIYGAQIKVDPTAVPPNGSAPVSGDAAAPALPTGAPAADPTMTQDAPTGAQVASLQALLESAKEGKLAPEAAVHSLLVAFPGMSEDRARAMVGAQVGQDLTPAQPASSSATPPGGAAAASPFRQSALSQMSSALRSVPTRFPRLSAATSGSRGRRLTSTD